MNNQFYIYLHRKADDRIPFYIGKGKGKRAMAKIRKGRKQTPEHSAKIAASLKLYHDKRRGKLL